MKRRSKAATETNWEEVRADYEGDVPVTKILKKYRISQNLLYEKIEELGWLRKKTLKRPVERLHRLIEQQIGAVEKKFNNRKTRPPNEKQIAQLATLTKLLDQIVRLRRPLNEKNSIEQVRPPSPMRAGIESLRAVLALLAEHPDSLALLKALPDPLVADLLRDWPIWGRKDQCPSYEKRRWTRWLILGGRGAGKTRTGAEWVSAKIAGQDWTGAKAGRIALIGGSLDEARAVMVEGVSGLLAVA